MRKFFFLAAGVLAAALFSPTKPAQAQNISCVYNASPPSVTSGNAVEVQCDTNGQVKTTTSATATVAGGFTDLTTGTPIAVTTGGVTGTLPAGTVVVATNAGATNAAYCKLGASATTSDQYIAPAGGWFSFQVGGATQLTCITSTSTTTVNMTGGSGLPTGTGGGGGSGGGGGGAVTMASGAVASGAYAAGSLAAGAGVDGWNLTEGAKADSAWVSGSGSIVAILKTIANSVGAAIPAGTNVIGHVITDSGSVVAGTGTAGSAATGVLTVQGIASMTKLLVTPDSVALPANQSVNESQINGVTPLMGNGVTGTGSQRVTIASDNTAFAVNSTLQAGSALVGKVGIDQTTPGTTNAVALAQIGSVTTSTGAGATGTGTQRVGVAQDTTTIAGSAPGTAGSASSNVVTVQGVGGMTKLLVTPDANSAINVAQINGNTTVAGNGVTGTGSQRVTIASDNTAFAVNAQPSPTASGGLTTFFLQPAASDNHTNVKNGAGQVYHVAVTNNSATVNYLRFYNAATGFNGCNSATNLVYQLAIPASTSGAGFVQDIALGIAFSTGISICVSSGYATTDTTNATASAMSVFIGYK